MTISLNLHCNAGNTPVITVIVARQCQCHSLIFTLDVFFKKLVLITYDDRNSSSPQFNIGEPLAVSYPAAASTKAFSVKPLSLVERE
jgi:hypothetical protein